MGLQEDIQNLQDGIDRSKNNIRVFEEAIEKERQTIKEYYFMIDSLERKARESNRTIEIEAERED